MTKQKIFFFFSIIFFLILNWGAIFFSWQGRNLPPEPDDAGVFLTFIQANIKYPTVFSRELNIFKRPFQWNEYGGFDRVTYFSWALFWGKLAKIFFLSPELALFSSFLFGIGLFLATTLYFFKEENLIFKSLLILTAAFFTGDGIYQGFFWPGPSLYAVSLFLLVLKIILTNNKKWFIKLLIITPIFLTLHPLSIIGLASLFVFICLNRFFLKNNALLRKRLLIFLILSLSFYLLWFNFLTYKNIKLLDNTNIIKIALLKFFRDKFSISSSSLRAILNKYFLYLATRPFFLTLFILGIVNIFKKNKALLCLLVSFFILLIPAIFFSGGERVLLFAWLLTFYIFSFGVKFIFDYFKNNKKNITNLEKRIVLLMLINLGLELFFILFIFKINSAKDLILKQFFYLTQTITLILIIIQTFLRRRLILILMITGLIGFFGYLSLEKIAMIVFQKERDNIFFDPKIFLININPSKNDPIIYNDNLSFALFSSSGLMEREVIKKGYLQAEDLFRASYFIAARSKFKDCQEATCWFKENKGERLMRRKAMDNNFLLYEF